MSFKLNVIEKMGNLQKEFEEKRKALQEELKIALEKAFEEYFQTFPEVKYITWTQYSPYFNDGDECIFHVHDGWAITADYSVDEEDEDGDYWSAIYDDKSGVYPSEAYYVEKLLSGKENAKAFAEFWSVISFDEELLKSIYGNHVRVTVYPDRTVVEEHYHD